MTTVRLVGIGIRDGDTWQVKAVNVTPSIITCKFHRWQFPSEEYTVDFDRVTGECLDGRFTCVKLDTGKQMVMPL
jgi:hypothetical protein